MKTRTLFQVTDEIQGWKLYYGPKGLGWVLWPFTKKTHTSVALDAYTQLHASQKHGKAVISEIEWDRKPLLVPLQWELEVFLKVKGEMLGDPYSEAQVISKALYVPTGWEWLVYKSVRKEGRDCSELGGRWSFLHSFFQKAVGQGWISKALQALAASPDHLTPDKGLRLDKKLARVWGKKPIKRYIRPPQRPVTQR